MHGHLFIQAQCLFNRALVDRNNLLGKTFHVVLIFHTELGKTFAAMLLEHEHLYGQE